VLTFASQPSEIIKEIIVGVYVFDLDHISQRAEMDLHFMHCLRYQLIEVT
jgi:hypothetical protein